MKLALLIVYFAVMIGIGIYCRKQATDVNGFVRLPYKTTNNFSGGKNG